MLKQFLRSARPPRRKRRNNNVDDFEPEAIPLIDHPSSNIHIPSKPRPTPPTRQEQRHSQIMHFTKVVAVTMTAVGLMAPAVAAPVPQRDSIVALQQEGCVNWACCPKGDLHVPYAWVRSDDGDISKREEDFLSTEMNEQTAEKVVPIPGGFLCEGPLCAAADGLTRKEDSTSKRESDFVNIDMNDQVSESMPFPGGAIDVVEDGIGRAFGDEPDEKTTDAIEQRQCVQHCLFGGICFCMPGEVDKDGISENTLSNPAVDKSVNSLDDQSKPDDIAVKRDGGEGDPDDCNPIRECHTGSGMKPGSPPI
ncbi:hypothetical protein M409DRAFT_49057 [Zasmidium cellare ATCC 36951]|uniref:Uncharacterized protein n=1 Tax=Zasmidium cellare ATCC 36951 TaxID=1080233 RepID=A0A6A6D558_ZASCE|nr:uncharacterized protein M409DRAFT_49057 [Zasmidium cellare ATCC 36951]KAF2174195.1 hypothetical protein M409DRAFT_49057 [Zasmidium cellare ATCC 36951]